MSRNVHLKSRPLSGMTLPEVLISSAIFGMILLGLYSMLSFSLSWSRKLGDGAEVYQQALRAASKISYDLGTGSSTSFIYGVDGFGFSSFRPDSGLYQLDSAGKLLLHRHIVYHLDGDTLRRGEIPIATPTSAPPSFADFLEMKNQLTDPGAVMARGVSDLEILAGSGSSLRFRVSGAPTNEKNSILLQQRITFRN